MTLGRSRPREGLSGKVEFLFWNSTFSSLNLLTVPYFTHKAIDRR